MQSIHAPLIPTLVFTASFFVSAKGADPLKVPRPDQAKVKEANGLIDEVFRERLSHARTATSLRALADTLLEEAAATSNDSAGRYALLGRARSLAIEGKDPRRAIHAADEMARYFAIDGLTLKKETLEEFRGTRWTAEQQRDLAEALVDVVNEALEQGRPNEATTLMSDAVDAARKSRDFQFARHVVLMSTRFDQIIEYAVAAVAAEEKLKDDSTDADASTELGKYRCFVAKQWDDGLPLLAQSADGDLASLAESELGQTGDVNDWLALADGWWDYSNSSDGIDKEASRKRAIFWYRQALPHLTGLSKLKAEHRIASVDESQQMADDATEPDVPKTIEPQIPHTAVGFGGSRYAVVEKQVTWQQAETECEAMGGHLACAESRAEFILQARLAAGRGLWIGGHKVDGKWTWVTGEPIKMFWWAKGQPDNWNEGEDCLTIGGTGLWNDSRDNHPHVVGFICEWE